MQVRPTPHRNLQACIAFEKIPFGIVSSMRSRTSKPLLQTHIATPMQQTVKLMQHGDCRAPARIATRAISHPVRGTCVPQPLVYPCSGKVRGQFDEIIDKERAPSRFGGRTAKQLHNGLQ
jgi:hypothetical protein